MTTLGSLLVQNHVVGVVEIEKALQRQVIMGGDLATNLLELSLVKEDALARHAAKAFGMQLLDKALLDAPEERVVKMFPWETAEQHRVVPVSLEGSVMIVGTSQPIPEKALEEVGFLLGVSFSPRFVLEFRLAIALNRCYGTDIPKRMAKLQKKLAPESLEAVSPIVSAADRERTILSGTGVLPAATQPEPETEESATLPAAPDYLRTIQKSIQEERLSRESAEEASPHDQATVVAEAVPLPQEAGSSEPPLAAEGEALSSTPADRPSDAAPSTTPRKERVPFNMEKIANQLLQVTHRDEILNVFMENVSSVFDFAMLFVIHGKDAEAHLKTDNVGDIEKVDSPVLTVDSGGMLEIAYNTRSFYLGQTGKNDTDRLLLAEMNRPRPRNCAIIPVSLRNRVVMLLYGDCGKQGVKAEQMSDLSQLARLVSEAFERLLLEKKYGQYRSQASRLPSRPAHQAFSRVPSGRLSDMPNASGLYRFVHSDTSGKMRPSMAAATALGAQEQFDDTGEMEKDMPDLSAKAPKEAMNPAMERAFEAAGSGGVHAERIINITPGDPPRSVVVNMQEEIDRLVSRVITLEKYDKVAVEVLAGIGVDAVRKLVEHFPGPLAFDRYQETDKLPTIGRHGHLLKALTKFGKIAVPHILPLLESHDTDVRFYATFLFSELKFPEALDTLTDRLFDADRHIRAIAIDVIRGFNAHPEYRWAVEKLAGILESTDRDLETKYLAAQALGELGEPLAIEPLARLLDSPDEKLVRIVHRALTKIGLVDHGFSEKRWIDWYQKNSDRSRIEWAIDGLIDEEGDIREFAFRTLKARTEDVVTDTDPPATLREYRELQERLKKWWRDEGQEIHQLTEGS